MVGDTLPGPPLRCPLLTSCTPYLLTSPLTICTHPVHLPQARQHPTVGGRVTGLLTTPSNLGDFRSRPAEGQVYVHQSVHVPVLPYRGGHNLSVDVMRLVGIDVTSLLNSHAGCVATPMPSVLSGKAVHEARLSPLTTTIVQCSFPRQPRFVRDRTPIVIPDSEAGLRWERYQDCP